MTQVIRFHVQKIELIYGSLLSAIGGQVGTHCTIVLNTERDIAVCLYFIILM